MKKTILCTAIAAIATFSLSGCNSDDDTSFANYGEQAMDYLVQLTDPAQGIGARPTGTPLEDQTGAWITDTLTGFGYDVVAQDFSYTPRGGGQSMTSTNYIVQKQGLSSDTVVIVAHYDSTGEDKGSLGATDNGAGVVTAITVAQALKARPIIPYTVRVVLVGAEENGVNGSKYYVTDALANGGLANVVGVINIDTNAGGDIMYVHSAHSDYDAEFKSACESIGLDDSTYNYETWMRDSLLNASSNVLGGTDKFVLHPDVAGYPEGETGSWSDHAPFACAGIAIANLEATNYEINGQHGYDGYSQTTNDLMWSTGFNTTTMTANDRNTETKWGKIWHTEFDRLDKLEEAFPGRVDKQVADSVDTLIEFLTKEEYITH